ncbi:hypothetical protein ACP275_09G032300 [Erythranthe tilingii]
MAHNTSHRRNLAAPDPHHTTPMDPTHRNINPTTTANNHRRRYHHPIPDPTTAAAAPPPPPSTIQNISHRFSKLYSNHKKLVTKPQHPHPEPETHTSFTTTTTTLTKSSSHHERRNTTTTAAAAADKDHYYLGTKTKAAKEKDGPKKTVPKKDPQKRSSFDAQLMDEEVKMVGRISVSSIPPPMANGGGRRRSFCSSQVELADFFSATGVRVVAVDMPPFMQIHAVDCARKAHDSLEKFTSKTLAFTLKKEFDGVYGPAWHCIVGTSFGSFVTHSVGGFMYFSMDHKIYILLFKTTVQRAQELN